MLNNEELAERLTALEKKVEQSLLLMRRPGSEEYEKLVDVVCDHDTEIRKDKLRLENIESEIEKGPTSDGQNPIQFTESEKSRPITQNGAKGL